MDEVLRCRGAQQVQRCPAGAEVQVQRSCRAAGVSTGAGAGAGVKVQRCKGAKMQLQSSRCNGAKLQRYIGVHVEVLRCRGCAQMPRFLTQVQVKRCWVVEVQQR